MSKTDFEEDITKAVEVLRNGGVILYPTDTIWGLGCDATNDEAVQRIFEIKKREDSKSMIVLLADDGQLQRYVREIPEVAWDIIDLSEKPTTVVFSDGYNLADQVTADDGSIGIRITKDPFCQRLIRKLNKPIVSTSANFSGESTPSYFGEVKEEIKKAVDYVVKHRQDDRKPASPSAVIKLEEGGLVKVIRK